MRKPISLIAGVVVALSVGFSFAPVVGDGAATGTAARPQTVYHQPRIGGLDLDVRLMGHVLPDPLSTAARFCRDNGSTGVASFLVRPGGATRTIGDGAVHASPGVQRHVFSIIRCEAPVEILLATR